MTGKQKTHGTPPSMIRALVKNDPLLREVDIEMVAQAICFAIGVFVVLFAAKGWVVTWC